MTEQQKQQRLAATKQAMAEWLAKPVDQRTDDLKQIGILDEEGRLSSRYGGPGRMTTPKTAGE
jgi:hypothetical protein